MEFLNCKGVSSGRQKKKICITFYKSTLKSHSTLIKLITRRHISGDLITFLFKEAWQGHTVKDYIGQETLLYESLENALPTTIVTKDS
jgi:hypothetical protein